jgi:hypothetical protein
MSQKRTAHDPALHQNADERSREDRRRRAFLRKRLAASRVRDLFVGLMRQIDPAGLTPKIEADALRVAELTVAAENLRETLLATAEADAALINSVTRLESTARRASIDLGKVAPLKADRAPTIDEWLHGED